MNPCPCGYLSDPRRACRCNATKIANYVGMISGPLLDRIDIHLEAPAARYQELPGNLPAEEKELRRLAMSTLGLSARAYDKMLKVSRMIADLTGSDDAFRG